MLNTPPIIKIDQCHLDFIYGILVSHKPKKVLELGMGSCVVTDIILRAFKYNSIPLDLTCVDNWYDWSFEKPNEISKYEKKGVVVITSAESDFVFSCKDKYDLIISDADHCNSNKWFKRSLLLLRTGGIIIYHDVTNADFPNLFKIYSMSKREGLPFFLFNTSSKAEERCERGLLIIRKNQSCRRPLRAFLLSRIWKRIKDKNRSIHKNRVLL